MSPQEFALNPADFGLPTREQLRAFRIWDLHYHGFYPNVENIQQHEQMRFYIERMGVERSLAIDIGGSKADLLATSPNEDIQRRILLEQKDRLSGMVRVDPTEPDRSCQQMEKWIRNGPCVGIKFYGGNKGGVVCSHPNTDPIIRLARELKAIVYIHTWMKIGGDPRRPAGGNLPGESAPMDVVELAKRFPDLRLICGHSGGDWELGAQVVRPQKNVYFEFAGSDPHSGAVDYAVRELGLDRIVWGGHGPSRSFATEFSKVLDADLTTAQRMQIFGGNLRRLAEPIFRQKGEPISV
ncbi:MAG: amidohydrolase family protein [Opitutaceae bacterium]|nr:amidohydrolase family protein [Opitutaceae bacterium]